MKPPSRITRVAAPTAGTIRPSRSGIAAAPAQAQTNTPAAAHAAGPWSGATKRPTTVIAVIASEPPIQSGVSTQ